MDNSNKKSEVSFFNANITPIMSVALVLFLCGIVAVLAIIGNNLADKVKGNIGFNVVLSENATDADVARLKQQWNRAEYVASSIFISKDDAMANWQRDTGENLIEVFGVNPLSAEFEIHVKPEYASTDSIAKIAKAIRQNPAVESVEMQRELIDSINRNIENVSIILGIISVILTLISFALINNTVHLSVYSKRFLIHTMKLVGAKSSFIRRPFVMSNVLNGIIAGFIAILLLCTAIYYLFSYIDGTAEIIGITEISIVCVGIMIVGIVLCALAASIATNKYIRLDYDSLFKR